MATSLLNRNEGNGRYKKVHVIFGDSAAGCLRMVLRELGVQQEEKVITCSDFFSIGAVWQLHTREGRMLREEWLRKCFRHSEEESAHYIQSFQHTLHEIGSISPDVPIIIWAGENAYEQSGLRFALYLLREKINDIFLINTTETHKQLFNQPELTYFIRYTGEIVSERLQAIYEANRAIQPLTLHDRERLLAEWLHLADTQEVLRIWEEECVKSVPEEHFDSDIIQAAQELHSQQEQKNFMKAARVVGQALGEIEQCIGDEFLEYRLRMLISRNIFEVMGSLEAMRYYSVQLK